MNKRHYFPRNRAEWVCTILWLCGGTGAILGGMWLICKLLSLMMGVLA